MTAQDQDKFVLRLPDGMRDQLKADALANDRSMNAEIIARLAGSQANLRDQFAMAALTGILSAGRHGVYMRDGEGVDADNPSDLKVEYPDEGWVAHLAFCCADEMIAHREVKS